jgi:biotin operon repressor
MQRFSVSGSSISEVGTHTAVSLIYSVKSSSSSKPVGLTNANSFDLPITQSKLADATGLSSVHVNRSLMQLRADGLITLDKGRCTIPDLERLREAAMFEEAYLHLPADHEAAYLNSPQSSANLSYIAKA